MCPGAPHVAAERERGTLMSRSLVRATLLAGALLGAGAARADFASVLQPSPIAASTAVAFQDSNVQPGTTSANGLYNFLDSWSFTLDGSFLVSSIAAAINFTDVDGHAVLFGITNLQVNLVTAPPSGPPIVSWLSVSAPATGLQQTVALVPPSALGSGTYTLEVRGDVTQPGAYSGSLIAQPLAPVPVPTTSALFACGILALGFTASRLRRS
jgi:hypothetical protein